ncbi:MAG: M48 family metallopeptidase [Clostridiales bacterium]|nr:M48 family metallopeptidase [Clostridiales bacterium]
MRIDYSVIRSNRKSIAIQVAVEGVIVRAPFWMTDSEIARFVKDHEDWIKKHKTQLEQQLRDQSAVVQLSMDEVEALADKALKVIPERVKYYAPLVGVDYGHITIRNQRTRWGSCSAKGNLNFNCLLMLAPPEVLDSVVVHELCHRKVMNHSRTFYDEVYRVYPEYDKWNGWLKEHGSELMRRMTGCS